MQLPQNGNAEIVGWSLFPNPTKIAMAAAKMHPGKVGSIAGGILARAKANIVRYNRDKNVDVLAAQSAELVNALINQLNSLNQVKNPQYIAGQISTLKTAFAKIMKTMPGAIRGKIMIRPAFRTARVAFTNALGAAKKHQAVATNDIKVAAARQKAAAAAQAQKEAQARAAGQAAGKAEAAAEVAAAKAAGKAEVEAAKVEAKASYDAQLSVMELENKKKRTRNLLIGGGVAAAAAAAAFMI